MTSRKTRSGKTIAYSSDKLYALIDANRKDDGIEIVEQMNRVPGDPNDILDYAISKDAHHAVWAILRYRSGMLNKPRAFRALIPFLPRAPSDLLNERAKNLGRIARRLGGEMIQLIHQDQALATQLFDALHSERRRREHKVIDPAIWHRLPQDLQLRLDLSLTATVIMGVNCGRRIWGSYNQGIHIAELRRRFEPTPDKILNLGRALSDMDGFPLLAAFAEHPNSSAFVGPIASICPWTTPLKGSEWSGSAHPGWFFPKDVIHAKTTASAIQLVRARVDAYRCEVKDVFQSLLGVSGLSHLVSALVV